MTRTRAEQHARQRCPFCGDVQHFEATASPWEFVWRCRCGHGVVSWSHQNLPPVLVGVKERP